MPMWVPKAATSARAEILSSLTAAASLRGLGAAPTGGKAANKTTRRETFVDTRPVECRTRI